MAFHLRGVNEDGSGKIQRSQHTWRHRRLDQKPSHRISLGHNHSWSSQRLPRCGTRRPMCIAKGSIKNSQYDNFAETRLEHEHLTSLHHLLKTLRLARFFLSSFKISLTLTHQTLVSQVHETWPQLCGLNDGRPCRPRRYLICSGISVVFPVGKLRQMEWLKTARFSTSDRAATLSMSNSAFHFGFFASRAATTFSSVPLTEMVSPPGVTGTSHFMVSTA